MRTWNDGGRGLRFRLGYPALSVRRGSRGGGVPREPAALMRARHRPKGRGGNAKTSRNAAVSADITEDRWDAECPFSGVIPKSESGASLPRDFP